MGKSDGSSSLSYLWSSVTSKLWKFPTSGLQSQRSHDNVRRVCDEKLHVLKSYFSVFFLVEKHVEYKWVFTAVCHWRWCHTEPEVTWWVISVTWWANRATDQHVNHKTMLNWWWRLVNKTINMFSSWGQQWISATHFITIHPCWL